MIAPSVSFAFRSSRHFGLPLLFAVFLQALLLPGFAQDADAFQRCDLRLPRIDSPLVATLVPAGDPHEIATEWLLDLVAAARTTPCPAPALAMSRVAVSLAPVKRLKNDLALSRSPPGDHRRRF